MSRKLHYFEFNGLAEPIRYILHYGQLEFEDIRYDQKSWPIKSVKDSLPYGQLPLYEEGNKTLNQSVAIARYVGSEANLVPTDPWEQAILDATVSNIYDFWKKVTEFFKEPDAVKKEAIKEEVLNVTVDFFFSRFEKELKVNNGYFSGKLSWAEFVLIGIIESTNLVYGCEIEKEYPTVVELLQKIRSLPGVKEYIASRKPYAM